MRPFAWLILSLAAPAAFAVACSSSSTTGATSSGTFGAGGSGGASTTATSSATGMDDGGLFDAPLSSSSSSGDPGDGGGKHLVYASTDDTLFSLDPLDPMLTLSQIGQFDCITNGMNKAMTDVAVNKDDELWGVTGHDLYPLSIQGNTVHCGSVIHLSQQGGGSTPTFYALTFTPIGILDAAKEVLVAGNSAGELWAINAQGQISQHGVFGTVPAADPQGHPYDAANVGKAWELSGDMVFLANGGNPVGFATVRDCPNPPSTMGCSYVDTLIEIDVPKLTKAGAQPVIKAVRGQIVKRAGCNDGWQGDYGSMFGIAAWNDLVFGFSRTGNLTEISNVDGSACLVKSYSPNKFSGAAVTTLAPVIPPPPPK